MSNICVAGIYIFYSLFFTWVHQSHPTPHPSHRLIWKCQPFVTSLHLFLSPALSYPIRKLPSSTSGNGGSRGSRPGWDGAKGLQRWIRLAQTVQKFATLLHAAGRYVPGGGFPPFLCIKKQHALSFTTKNAQMQCISGAVCKMLYI